MSTRQPITTETEKPDQARFHIKATPLRAYLSQCSLKLCLLRQTNSQRQTSSKMKIRWSSLQILLLSCCLSASQANRVYVHPFHLFAAENVSCETLHTQTSRPLQTLPVAPLDISALTADSREQSGGVNTQRQNITERTDVLAVLQNTLGLRMYQALSSKQPGTNTLLSPISTYGTLVTLYLGASKRTASSFQVSKIPLAEGIRLRVL